MMWKIFKMQVTDIVTYIIAAYLLWIIGWLMVWLIPIYFLYKMIVFIAESWKNSSSRD
jgi:cobalamin biosynthesis protein CobD/CbiB|tara:strand:+ start:122 stop:295 length:174 start_codon:yes stop_codon:yes gene_type:complete